MTMHFDDLLSIADYKSTTGHEVCRQHAATRSLLDSVQGHKPTSEQLQALSELQQNLAAALLSFRGHATTEPNFGFSDAERLLIDFGFLDEDLLDSSGSTLTYCRQEISRPEEISGLTIQYATEILQSSYQSTLRIPEQKSLHRQHAEMQASLAAMRQDLKRLQVRRNAIVKGQREYEPLTTVFEKIDRALPAWAQVRSRMENSSDLSPRERRSHYKLGEEFSMLQDEESHLIGAFALEEQLSHIASTIVRIAIQLPKEEQKLAKILAEEKAVKQAQAQLSQSTAIHSHVEELTDLFGRLRLCGGTAYRQHNTVLTKTKNLRGKLDIIHSVESVTDADQVLWHKWQTESWKRPKIGMLPGRGDAVYEETNNNIWVPILLRKEPELAMAEVLGNYRLSACRESLTEFGALKANKGIKTVKSLRQKFVQAYSAWCLRDAKGFRSLPKEVRNWFISRVYQKSPDEEATSGTT